MTIDAKIIDDWLSISPDRINFGVFESSSEKEVVLRPRVDNTALSTFSVAADHEFVTAESRAIADGEASLSVVAAPSTPGFFEGFIVVKSADGLESTIKYTGFKRGSNGE